MLTNNSLNMNGRICAAGSESASGIFCRSSSRESTPSPARNDVKPSAAASPAMGSPEAKATSWPAAASARASGSIGR